MNPGDDRIRERRGFKAFQRMERTVLHALGGPQSEEVDKIVKSVVETRLTDEFLDFVEFVLLHTLAHTFKNVLTQSAGCKPEDLGYYIEHPLMRSAGIQSGKIRIIVYETAVGGFGYLKNLSEGIENGTNEDFLTELLSEAADAFTASCKKKSEKELRDLGHELEPFAGEYKSLIDATLTAYSSTFAGTGIYPHVNSIRRAIAEILPEILPEVRPMVDDALGKGPHCWDGCQLCVMLERECNFLPFDQPFLVSRELLIETLGLLVRALKEPTSHSPLKVGITRQFESFLQGAEQTIDLVSPWISPEVIERIRTHQGAGSVIVRIITKEDPNNQTQIKTIDLLGRIQANSPEQFQVRIVREIHAKG